MIHLFHSGKVVWQRLYSMLLELKSGSHLATRLNITTHILCFVKNQKSESHLVHRSIIIWQRIY